MKNFSTHFDHLTCDFYVDMVYAVECPALAMMYAVKALALHHYIANLHHWKANKEVVLANLEKSSWYVVELYGPIAVMDYFDKTFGGI